VRPIVLAVDDEQEVCDLLEESLSREGMDVHSACSLSEFRGIEREICADIFIVDLTLPDGTGFSLVRELREKSDKGIIIVSGRCDETDSVLGLELGADDFVRKPFRTRELAARINAVLRRRGSDLKPVQTVSPATVADSFVADHAFDGYQICFQARRLLDGSGQEILLTTAEFELLRALIEARGRVLSRDQLMNEIKGRDWEAYDRAVDGLVSRIRKKIPSPAGKAHYIRTVHGMGYAFTG
jgi:two-component system torCAD operon response regulator TorR